MRKTLRIWHVACVATLAAAFLSACGSSSPSGAAAALLHPKSTKDKPSTPKVLDPTADMSAAVSAARGPSPVNVKFQMGARPEPGQPVSVDFALIPGSTVSSLAAKFEGDEGLTVVSGEQVPAIDKPAANVPIRHTVTVLPKADGIYTVTATLTLGVVDGDSRVRAFSIPVIAGDGLPQLAAHSDPAKTQP